MFFLKSLLFTIFSPRFYVEAVQKGLKRSLGTYFLFTLLVALFSSLYFGATFGYDLLKLPDKLDDFPEVTIENGELSLNPSQPYEFIDEGYYAVIDPTGETTEIPEGYAEGILLTQNSMIIRSTESYGDQTLTYDQILEEFDKDSFYLDHEMIASWVQSFGVIIILASPVFIFLGSFISRLISILFISTIGFVVLCTIDECDPFKTSFILAVYASIPVFYLNTLLGFVGKISEAAGINFSLGSLCCFIPIVFSLIKWGIFWGLGAYGLYQASKISPPTAQAATA